MAKAVKVAVLTLTRDRLEYTKRSFASLHANAGCEFDHYVLDQGSTDGTVPWLGLYMRELVDVCGGGQSYLPENVGIHRGMNQLLALAGARYDVYVTFDNDCEVTIPGTLAAAARVAHEAEWIVSPTVQGLINTPTPGPTLNVVGELVGMFWALGGIFRAMPAAFVRDFRFDETRPYWGGDENDVGTAAYYHPQIDGMGYLLNWEVTHMDTTPGQIARYPDYHARKVQEMFQEIGA